MAEKKGESTARRDLLLALQASAQAKWEREKVFEVDAPAAKAPKFFGNFPYPYMNGLLHLGHAFSLSKLEFAAAYHRLKGEAVLFPFAFHCTGMPIKACADKLDREIREHGLPPVFPEEGEEDSAAGAAAAAAAGSAAAEAAEPAKFKAKKSKAAAKSTGLAHQWDIMKMSGITEDAEIAAFREPVHWLRHFPPLAARDVRAMGCGVDWRRSFITTDANPYYDAFVRWQMRALHRDKKILKDKRLTIYSPRDGQPCADHDRATGEGVGPQEYVLIKMLVEEAALVGKLAPLKGRPLFLAAATLRPETMYGQTNCWVLPEGKYGAYLFKNDEVLVMTKRAATNAAYQEMTPEAGRPQCLLELTGTDLLGLPVRSPLALTPVVYVLPMLTILTNKGTGVVTSVPSDSPDDYMALCDLKAKAALRTKYGITDSMVLPFEVIPIINIPEFGDASAVRVCTDLKIKSQNDRALLDEAKRLTYLKGFVEGVMLVGPHKGKKVADAKPLIRAEMIAAGQALLYSEPERSVMSRSGEECVVALTDQWYLIYGDTAWREATERALAQLDAFHPETRAAFEHTLGWLRQWACSRSFGLGTRLPWDPQFLVESLSDSTVYMAYYTVAHLLQGGDMFGLKAGPVKPEQLTDEVWDYVFGRAPASAPPTGAGLPAALLQTMRREFEFWYPWDLRVSGKDLIQNHLTFALYNHTAIWPSAPERWPRAIRCNGHLLLNSEKMSKSTGNFLTLQQAILDFSADAMRVALADAGDSVDDANFVALTANAAVLRLTKELAWMEEVLAPAAPHRLDTAAATFADRVFANALDQAVTATEAAYERMMFRDALKTGFYDLLSARDAYRAAVGSAGLQAGLVARFVDVFTRLNAPICPHTCEHIWGALLKRPGTVLKAGWPKAQAPDLVLSAQAAYLEEAVSSWRKAIAKVEAPPKKAAKDVPPPPKVSAGVVWVAGRYGGWQESCLSILAQAYDAKAKTFPPEASIMASIQASPLAQQANFKEVMKSVMPFVKFKMEEAIAGAGAAALQPTLPFDEAALLRDNAAYITRSLAIKGALEVKKVEDGGSDPFAARIAAAHPGTPVAIWDVEKPFVAPTGPPMVPASPAGGAPTAKPAANGAAPAKAPAKAAAAPAPAAPAAGGPWPVAMLPWWDERSVKR